MSRRSPGFLEGNWRMLMIGEPAKVMSAGGEKTRLGYFFQIIEKIF
jgi:hypothetical protein